jgi:tetratricopeptide (TPR) repeat protein
LQLFRAVGARLGEANVLKAIGDVQNFRKEMDAALASYADALQLFRAVGARLGEANVLASQGKLYVVTDPDRANGLLDQAIAIYRQIGSRYSIPAQIGNFGWELLRLGEHKCAQPYLLQAANLFEEIGLTDYAERHRIAAAGSPSDDAQ